MAIRRWNPTAGSGFFWFKRQSLRCRDGTAYSRKGNEFRAHYLTPPREWPAACPAGLSAKADLQGPAEPARLPKADRLPPAATFPGKPVSRTPMLLSMGRCSWTRLAEAGRIPRGRRNRRTWRIGTCPNFSPWGPRMTALRSGGTTLPNEPEADPWLVAL